jgi:hypothetical protein
MQMEEYWLPDPILPKPQRRVAGLSLLNKCHYSVIIS